MSITDAGAITYSNQVRRMDKMYAFIDESGAFGFNFDTPSCSQFFIVCAIIVRESDLSTLEEEVERIRKKHFQTGEMKSSQVGRNNQRRKRILDDLLELPYHIYAFICDKKKIGENAGLKYKQPFYKFLNNLAYEELKVAFPQLTIVADAVGDNDFLQSFCKYIKAKNQASDLFGENYLNVQDSKNSVLIQLADFISGSLSYSYEPNKITQANGYNYTSILNRKMLMMRRYPRDFHSYMPPEKTLDPNYDRVISEISYRQAIAFREKYKDENDEFVQRQIVVLDYLLFRFMNLSPRHYIPTRELQNQLTYRGFEKISTQVFRAKVIAKLRDKRVIISSCSHGYKLPSTQQELRDFISLGKNMVNPLLSRLHACHEIIKLGTNGALDLFAEFHFVEDINKTIGNAQI